MFQVLKMDSIDEPREAYRNTWREFANKLTALQQLRQTGIIDTAAIEAAVLDLEKARLAHAEARDLLAEELDAGLGDVVHETEPTDGHVSASAHLLWDLAGRPDGTAEKDWHRARELVGAAKSR